MPAKKTTKPPAKTKATTPKQVAKKPPAKAPTKASSASAGAPAKAPTKKLPTVAVKPKKATAPSIPLPPPPPPPPAVRDELAAPHDIGRLLRYGERFGPHRIDIRMLPIALPVSGTAILLGDPANPKSWRELDRPLFAGQFRTMLSVAKDDANKERLAAVVMHAGRPPIARWTVAHFKGQKRPKDESAIPGVAVSSGYLAIVDAKGGAPAAFAVPSPTGPNPISEVGLPDGRKAIALPCAAGDHTAYWAIDAADKPVCLVVDFDVISQKDWKAKPPKA